MRLSSVLELARQYLLLGAIFAVFAAAAAVFGYFFVYKKYREFYTIRQYVCSF